MKRIFEWVLDCDTPRPFIGVLLLWAVVFVAYWCGALLWSSVNLNPGDAERSGQITAVSHAGLLCKTWEARLERGGLKRGTGQDGAAEAFLFTMRDTALVTVAQAALRNHTEVRVAYHTQGLLWPCSSSSGGDFATSITPDSSR